MAPAKEGIEPSRFQGAIKHFPKTVIRCLAGAFIIPYLDGFSIVWYTLFSLRYSNRRVQRGNSRWGRGNEWVRTGWQHYHNRFQWNNDTNLATVPSKTLHLRHLYALRWSETGSIPLPVYLARGLYCHL